jgi:hypothetical protein
VGCGFCISIYWIYIKRNYTCWLHFQSQITQTSHFFWFLFLRNCCDQLLCRTLVTNCFGETAMTNSFGETALANSYDELLSQTPIPDCYDRLLFQTPMADSHDQIASIINPSCFYNLGDQLLVCSLPRSMHFYRPLLSCNNTPLFRLPRLFCLQNCWEQFRGISGYIILMNYASVAWQWISRALCNSAFQTTCHNILSLCLTNQALCHECV